MDRQQNGVSVYAWMLLVTFLFKGGLMLLHSGVTVGNSILLLRSQANIVAFMSETMNKTDLQYAHAHMQLLV